MRRSPPQPTEVIVEEVRAKLDLDAFAQQIFISYFSNPSYPAVKGDDHLKAIARQCIKAAKIFEKEWKDAY